MKLSLIVIATAIATTSLPAMADNVDNAKDYARTCSESHFQGIHGTFKTLPLLDGAAECEYLTMKNIFPGVIADSKLMAHFLELDGLTRDNLDIELEKEPDNMMKALFGLRDIVNEIYTNEMSSHCTYLGGHNETSTVSCK